MCDDTSSILSWLKQGNFGGGNLTQGCDNFLIIGFDQRTRALEELFGAPRSTQNQFEAIRNDFEAVFDSNTCHRELIFRLYSDLVNAVFPTSGLAS